MHDRPLVLKHRPQVNFARPAAFRMWLICGCASLAVAQSAASDRGASLAVALAALAAAVLAELLITARKNGFRKIGDGSAAASALVLALLLPNQIQPVYAALGAFFAMAVVKHSFGGLGSNWLNPALGGWLFVRFSWPGVFGAALEDAPLALAGGSLLDGGITSALNQTVFSLFRAELPAGYIDLLFSRSPGIIADRGLLALLAGTVLITAFGVSRSWIPAVFLGLYGILARFAGGTEGLWTGDALYALGSGGAVAAAFILAPEPASGAKSRTGALTGAALGGLFAWIIRYPGAEYYGCLFAVALVNALTPLIRLFERRRFYACPRRESVPEGLP